LIPQVKAAKHGLQRDPTILRADPSRVLLRPFIPGDEHRIAGIVSRIMALTEPETRALLSEVCREFSKRHQNIGQKFLERSDEVRAEIGMTADLSEERRKLIGSYFLAEYSLEAAALFNPSMMRHPDQSGLSPGDFRFILSLRATGEGHISSITFRAGILRADGLIEVESPHGFLVEPRQIPNPLYEKGLFSRTVLELGLSCEFTQRVIDKLDDKFSLGDLRARLDAERELANEAEAHGIWTLAKSNHEVQFQPEQKLSERILFPATPSQRNGIEDARFVCFHNQRGPCTYYATFTAYDGKVIMPELVETMDFLRFRFLTLNGPAARNKGMALFPRKIQGRYAMLGRQDNENIFLMFSPNVHFWNESQVLLKPKYPWELIQMGNCGSPIETEAGWLVLSHGVGPMRKYCIGAFLLDRDNPAKVLGRLREPLLMPNAAEREGYVPNAVYSCGSLIHNGRLIIPYGLADQASGFATVPLGNVLSAMTPENN
jgi:predicted GH43/DUF377 family glycosyl hydrolase